MPFYNLGNDYLKGGTDSTYSEQIINPLLILMFGAMAFLSVVVFRFIAKLTHNDEYKNRMTTLMMMVFIVVWFACVFAIMIDWFKYIAYIIMIGSVFYVIYIQGTSK